MFKITLFRPVDDNYQLPFIDRRMREYRTFTHSQKKNEWIWLTTRNSGGERMGPDTPWLPVIKHVSPYNGLLGNKQAGNRLTSALTHKHNHCAETLHHTGCFTRSPASPWRQSKSQNTRSRVNTINYPSSSAKLAKKNNGKMRMTLCSQLTYPEICECTSSVWKREALFVRPTQLSSVCIWMQHDIQLLLPQKALVLFPLLCPLHLYPVSSPVPLPTNPLFSLFSLSFLLKGALYAIRSGHYLLQPQKELLEPFLLALVGYILLGPQHIWYGTTRVKGHPTLSDTQSCRQPATIQSQHFHCYICYHSHTCPRFFLLPA